MAAIHKLSSDDRFALIDFIHKFFELVDSGRASETADMFSAGAKLRFGPGSPKPGTLVGDEIASAMVSREKLTGTTTRHAISNICLLSESDSQVQARYLLTLFRSDAEPRTSYPAFVADVEEVLVRETTGWMISTRIVTPVFSRP